MRKRSILLMVFLGVGALLFLSLFLFAPSKKMESPEQQVKVVEKVIDRSPDRQAAPQVESGDGEENAAVRDPKLEEQTEPSLDDIEVIAGDRDAPSPGPSPSEGEATRDERRGRASSMSGEAAGEQPDISKMLKQGGGGEAVPGMLQGFLGGKTKSGPISQKQRDSGGKKGGKKGSLDGQLKLLDGDGGGRVVDLTAKPKRKVRKRRRPRTKRPAPTVVPDNRELDQLVAKHREKKERERATRPEPEPQPESDELDGFDNRVVETVTEIDTRMTETKIDPKSTFSIDVDTGAYTLARARMREGYRPRPESVRIEEFLNYFHYDYPEPADREFAVHLEAAPDPLSTRPRRHLVRVGVQGMSVPDAERPPAHLTFLVDVSGSMFGPDQLGLVIESLDLVGRNLRPDDTIALVTYSTEAKVRLWPAGASERDLVSRVVASLEPGGSSALDDGLDLAYEVASTHFVAGHINRVVLLGDGRANVGKRRPEELLDSVRYAVEDGVMLSTIGFGAKSFNDRMMEQLADNGNGAYYFVDSFREADKVFRDRLCGTLFAIAKDVKIQVEFNPESVLRHRLLGYENRRLEHHQFRDDAVDAGEIGAGHSVTAIYEVDLAPSLGETVAAVRIRYKKPDEARASEATFQLFAREIIDDVREASPDFKFAAAVALFAQIARGDVPGGAARISLVREIAGDGVPRPEDQPDRTEFLALLDETSAYYVN